MVTNDFKPFAIAPSANVTDQADYAALPALLSGFGSGVASSAQVNKALRQSTVLASVLAQFISNQLTVDVLDNGDTTTLLNNLIAALNSNGAASFLQKANNFSEIKAAGAVAQAAALTNLGSGDGTLNGRYLNTQSFPSTATYTPTHGTKRLRIRLWGGGAGGSGTNTNNVGAFSGGGGGFIEVWCTLSAQTLSVVIGAGGIGTAANSATTGGYGGNTSIIELGLTTYGGTASGGTFASTLFNVSLGVTGQDGQGSLSAGYGGTGGGASLSFGGLPHSGSAGGNGAFPGGGGAGASYVSGTPQKAGNGGYGLVIIEEYA
jgi:hypothetical protein